MLNKCIEGCLRCMVFQKPREWARWIPLAEWWYNTNYQTSLKTTSFEALYGYPPPQLSLSTIPTSMNRIITKTMEERQEAVRMLREQLIRAQNRMQKYADSKRSGRNFHKRDWVYLKLQPYRQISVQGKTTTHKLKQRYYGPFKVLEKIGVVVYELKLPQGTLIHPVFHVSQLKKCRGAPNGKVLSVPLLSHGGKIRVKPISILDSRAVKSKTGMKTEVLVKWSNLEDEEATWKNLE
jgi:Chromo (CHRromatin Organisation MOdifier) domain